MTAIILLACHSVRELVDLSDALWQNTFNIERSLNYYRIKRRLELFRFHCRELWLRQVSKTSDPMHRKAGIDFAAIEAGADCVLNMDAFDDTTTELHKRFLQAEGTRPFPSDCISGIEVVDGNEFKVRNRDTIAQILSGLVIVLKV